MLCEVALRCAQIKEDGMKTEALIELTAMTRQLTNQVISNSWFWAAVTCLIKRLLFFLMVATLAAGSISPKNQEGGFCICEIACLLAQMEGMLKSEAELQVRVTELTIAVRCVVWLTALACNAHHCMIF